MLNTKNNLKHKKLTEALGETITNTDPVLFIEMLGNVRESANDIIETIDISSISYEETKTMYELAEICSYILDKIFSISHGIE